MIFSNKHTRFFNAAYAVALASPGVGGRNHNSFRHGAVIVDKHILAARHNSLKTNPKLLKFFPWPFSHAEASAIISLGMDNCAGKSLYVVRVLRNNTIALSKPCSYCLSLIRQVGIKAIYYSINNGGYIEEIL